jgi:hypothetical protein
MSTEAPEAPPVAEPAAPAAPPAAPPQPEAPRVPPGQPEGGQFAPAVPAQPAAPIPAPPPVPAEPDWKAQAETARQEAAAAKAEAERWKQQSRTQEQRSKANHSELRNRDALMREMAVKLGIEFDDKPDPEVLSQRLTEAQTVAKQRTVELAVYTTAATAGANASALLDSRAFMEQTAALDPEAADFSFQVGELVRTAASDARYAVPQPPAPVPAAAVPAVQQQAAPAAPVPPAQPPAPSSGADFSGAPGGNRLWTQADYDHWTKPGMDRDGSVMAKAIDQGLLVNLGIGKPKRKTYR